MVPGGCDLRGPSGITLFVNYEHSVALPGRRVTLYQGNWKWDKENYECPACHTLLMERD